jgi:hypothetical protein
VDDRYLRYVVRRLSGFANVWWSMANEFDLMRSKSEQDWERLAAVVAGNDPAGHLRGIHNCHMFYDNTHQWVTHSSLHRVDRYRTTENVEEWRERWGKPVVVDECCYEGNLERPWGNISGQELTPTLLEAQPASSAPRPPRSGVSEPRSAAKAALGADAGPRARLGAI